MVTRSESNDVSVLKHRFSGRYYFSLFIIFSVAAFLIACIFAGSDILNCTFFTSGNFFFTDFFESLYDSSMSNPYESRNVIYPAFTYLFYKVFLLFVPSDIVLLGPFAIRDSQSGQLAFHIYCFVLIALLFCAIRKSMQRNDTLTKLFSIALIISSPVLYAYELGNSILVSLLFLILFFCYKDSDSKKMRELSLLFLAISAVFKIYPAVFGLILLTEKRIAEAFRCIIYGILLFVVPFFFYSGPSSIVYMFRNIFTLTGNFSNQYGYQVGISHALAYLSQITGLGELASCSSYFTVAFFGILVFSFLFAKEYFKRILALSLMCVMLPGFSWFYTLVYIIPAVIIFFRQHPKMNGNLRYGICFTLLFCHFPVNIVKIFPGLSVKNFSPLYEMTLGVIICNLVLWILTFLLLKDAINDLLLGCYEKKRRKHAVGR